MWIIGILLGCSIAFFLLLMYSCLTVAKRADEQMEQWCQGELVKEVDVSLEAEEEIAYSQQQQ